MSKKDAPNILKVPLTERQARNVASWLKRHNYDATVEQCRRKTIFDIAKFFEPYPLDQDSYNRLIRNLSAAAGLQPERKEK